MKLITLLIRLMIGQATTPNHLSYIEKKMKRDPGKIHSRLKLQIMFYQMFFMLIRCNIKILKINYVKKQKKNEIF